MPYREVTLQVQLEENPPPPPKRPPPKNVTRTRVHLPLGELSVGKAMRVPRSVSTVQKHMYEWLKTPEGRGQRFLVRPITKSMCRIWRIK